MKRFLCFLCLMLFAVCISVTARLSDERDYYYFGYSVDGSAERYDLIVDRRALVIYHDTTDNAGIRQYLNDEYGLSLASGFADDVAHSYNDTCIRGYSYYLDSCRYESIYDSLRADMNVYSVQRAFKSSRNGKPCIMCHSLVIDVMIKPENYDRMLSFADSIGLIPNKRWFNEFATLDAYVFDATNKSVGDAVTCCTIFHESGIVLAEDWNLGGIWYLYPESNSTSVEPTAVAPIPSEDSPRYDLSGRKITGPASGIYIQDGRKMLAPQK